MKFLPQWTRRVAMDGSVPKAEWCQQPAAITPAFPTPSAEAAYILDTFPIVKRKDEAIRKRHPEVSQKSAQPQKTRVAKVWSLNHKEMI